MTILLHENGDLTIHVLHFQSCHRICIKISMTPSRRRQTPFYGRRRYEVRTYDQARVRTKNIFFVIFYK